MEGGGPDQATGPRRADPDLRSRGHQRHAHASLPALLHDRDRGLTGALAVCGYILRGQWQSVEAYISPISTVIVAALVLLFGYRFYRQWNGRPKGEEASQPGE